MSASPAPSRLRITIVQGAFLPVPPLLGGAVEKAWFALGRAFAAAGHQVTHIGCTHPQLPRRERDAGVDYIRVPGSAATTSTWRLKLRDLQYSLRARRELPPADVLVTNTFWLPLLERRRSRGRVYVHVARFPKGQLRFYPRRAVLQTVSEPIRAAILREAGPAANVHVVPYPLAPLYLNERAPSQPVVLYAGRLHPEKGVHLLIEAFARLQTEGAASNWRLRIIGPWEAAHGGGGAAYRAQLETLAQRAPGRVEFTGPLFNETELVANYRSAAVFCYPSLAERGETFGLAVLEAMGSGSAPIVSDLSCFRDFVRPEENGLVFNHRAPDAGGELARSLRRVIENSDLRERLALGAWQTARDYALTTVADRYVDDFLSILENPIAKHCPTLDELSQP
ncbi:glycosyltransferase family 4 protein [Horticoccus luteus]|uniref:Glycosyltransferase family 4 protein n=1 Tax=Horticoccus luteus TaxID=2862869 RepID=A0A8F9TYI5_9BACT|nr:glycosyltransferase family 4 protein [Horticoccus luteus]QYM80337.1 glycosyltransferase family 4 protein [Horticoccus luteus]